MLKTNSRAYCRTLALVLLCGVVTSGMFVRSGNAKPKPPRKPAATFCACCPEHGMWEQQSKKLSDFEYEELAKLKFDGKSYLYSTAASPDDIKGISLPESEEGAALTVSRADRQWTLTVKSQNGETGKLILSLPDSATFFHADVTPGPKVWAAPSSVYIEIRLEGLVKGTGIFAKGMAAGTKYRLVLQGQGGMCFDPNHFYRWNLKVSGTKADFALYGFFSKARQ